MFWGIDGKILMAIWEVDTENKSVLFLDFNGCFVSWLFNDIICREKTNQISISNDILKCLKEWCLCNIKKNQILKCGVIMTCQYWIIFLCKYLTEETVMGLFKNVSPPQQGRHRASGHSTLSKKQTDRMSEPSLSFSFPPLSRHSGHNLQEGISHIQRRSLPPVFIDISRGILLNLIKLIRLILGSYTHVRKEHNEFQTS